MDIFSKGQRRKIMQSVKSKGSKIEILLSRELWRKGYRYQKNNCKVFGKPDLVFKKHKIAIFIDSEFWHGFEWENNKSKIKSNRAYWIPKIERNILRDELVTDYLQNTGWKVIRIWGRDIENNLENCIRIIEREYLNSRKEVL